MSRFLYFCNASKRYFIEKRRKNFDKKKLLSILFFLKEQNNKN